jgi:hypothetical protein
MKTILIALFLTVSSAYAQEPLLQLCEQRASDLSDSLYTCNAENEMLIEEYTHLEKRTRRLWYICWIEAAGLMGFVGYNIIIK